MFWITMMLACGQTEEESDATKDALEQEIDSEETVEENPPLWYGDIQNFVVDNARAVVYGLVEACPWTCCCACIQISR